MNKKAKRFKILIVDDHEVVRMGLRTLLERHEDLEIIGEAASAQEAVDTALKTLPDVVLMDVRLPDRSGIEACREIRAAKPDIRVLMLTSYSDEEAVVSSVIAGAAGYILKKIEAGNLYNAIIAVSNGETLIDQAVVQKVMKKIQVMQGGVSEQGMESLTDREKEILELVADGLTNKEIAEKVFLSEKTVRNYVSSILHKLNISHRTQAAVYFLERKHQEEDRE